MKRVEWSGVHGGVRLPAWLGPVPERGGRTGGASQPVAAGNLREGTLKTAREAREAATEPFHKQMHRWIAVWTRLASLISRHFHLLDLSFRGGGLS